MCDLILMNDGSMIRLENAEDGAVLHWEWEGCGGTLQFTNDQLDALARWIDKRNQPQSLPQEKP